MDRVNEKSVRVCKRCLLKEISEAEYRKLEEYILRLKEADRAQEALYQKRLAVCKACEKLSEGTCLACGCYVELRAAMAAARCPYKRW